MLNRLLARLKQVATGREARPRTPERTSESECARLRPRGHVRFNTNRYSTPRNCAFRAVTVKGYVNHIVVVVDGKIVARHDRCYGRREQILDPIHYLVTLGRRPAALDHTSGCEPSILTNVISVRFATYFRIESDWPK